MKSATYILAAFYHAVGLLANARETTASILSASFHLITLAPKIAWSFSSRLCLENDRSQAGESKVSLIEFSNFPHKTEVVWNGISQEDINHLNKTIPRRKN